MIDGTATFCGVHQFGRMFCGCPWFDVMINPAEATFTACIHPQRGDLLMQLREAEEMPQGIPIVVEAAHARPGKFIAADRDAWVRLAATRRIDVRCTPGRVREWRRAVAELGGAA